MKNILRLRHWQVFVIIFSTYLTGIVLWQSDFSVGAISSLEFSVFANLITMTLFFLWVLICGLYVNNHPGNPYRFRNSMLTFATLCSIIGHAEINLERLSKEGMIFPEWISFLVIPVTFFAVAYILYAIPKSLKSIELKRKARFVELIPDSILLFLFPVGVWFIQPRFNRVLDIMRR
jgi:hypothetical protein